MPMPTDRNRNLSLVYVWLAIIVIVLLQVLSKWVAPAFNNIQKEATLRNLEAEFDEIRHPEVTMLIVRQKTAGLLTNTSETCDFFIGDVRSYDGEKGQIADWYAAQKVKDEEIGLIFIENGEVPLTDKAQLPIMLASLSQWEVNPTQQDQPLYIVYLFQLGQDAETKIDCQ